MLKKQLIKLGYTNPELRAHLTPILDTLTKTASSKFEVILNRAKIVGDVEESKDYSREIRLQGLDSLNDQDLRIRMFQKYRDS